MWVTGQNYIQVKIFNLGWFSILNLSARRLRSEVIHGQLQIYVGLGVIGNWESTYLRL